MIDSNKPKSQTGSCVGPTVPRLRGDIVDCPAPEVWTDGFGGVHRKVFGESVALMFTASWLNHWGACWQDQSKWGHSKSKIACVCVSLCVDDVKGEMVSSSVFSFFCSVCHVLAVEHQATIIKKKQLWSVWLSTSLKVPPTNKMSSSPNGVSDTALVLEIRGGM